MRGLTRVLLRPTFVGPAEPAAFLDRIPYGGGPLASGIFVG